MGVSYSQIPEFDAGFTLSAGDSLINPGCLLYGLNNNNSAPCVVDWDDDGRKDLLVGSLYYGHVYLYMNTGTNEDPTFDTEIHLKDSEDNFVSVGYG